MSPSLSLGFAAIHHVRLRLQHAAAGLSPSAVLRAFERARTAALGGPAALRRLQSESIKCLVARMDELAFGTHPHTGLPGVTLGQPGLCVISSTSVRKARIRFEQSLVARGVDGAATHTVLARGLVTCLCVDGASGKMRSPPEWITVRFIDEQAGGYDAGIAADNAGNA